MSLSASTSIRSSARTPLSLSRAHEGLLREAPKFEVTVITPGLEAYKRHLARQRRTDKNRLPLRRAVARLRPGQHELARSGTEEAVRVRLDLCPNRHQLDFSVAEN